MFIETKRNILGRVNTKTKNAPAINSYIV
jgi:hypothetical protein